MSEPTSQPSLPPTGQDPRPLDQTLESQAPTQPESREQAPRPPDSITHQGEDASSSPARPAREGMPSVAGYEVLEELGRGGMGVVYKATQATLKRPVALKMIRDSALASPEQMNRLRTEAEAAARLQHPHIVQIYDYSQQNGLPFYVMEFVPGGNLSQSLHRNPQPARKAAELVEMLARAVHYAHQKGIIHRDLKPANVLLAPDGTPKISDFGLAKQLDSGSGMTPSTALLGTPSYMAPEQAGGKSKEVGPATDVYALGAILYEALTGRPPFEGDTLLHTLDQVRFQEPAPPTQGRPDVPPDLEAICLRCLQKEPSRRYASAADLAEDLQNFLAGRPIAVMQHRDTVEQIVIPGYEVWEEVGRGGLWAVYKARDVRAKRLVALKRIRAGSPLLPEHVTRLRATVEVARRLDHPHIAAIYDVGGALNGTFIAMEFVEGGSLLQKLGGQPLHARDNEQRGRDAAWLVETLARAVQHAHEQGLIHCHLQLANILLSPYGSRTEAAHLESRLGIPKLIGFEMARRRDDVRGMEDLYDIRPTSYAMAYEQLFGRHDEVGPPTDVYALGAILYQLLTGQPPYKATTTSDLLLKVGFEILQPPHNVNTDIHRVLGRICMKCLQKDRGKRYPTAQALADDLHAFQEGSPTTVGHPKSLWQRFREWAGGKR